MLTLLDSAAETLRMQCLPRTLLEPCHFLLRLRMHMFSRLVPLSGICLLFYSLLFSLPGEEVRASTSKIKLGAPLS